MRYDADYQSYLHHPRYFILLAQSCRVSQDRVSLSDVVFIKHRAYLAPTDESERSKYFASIRNNDNRRKALQDRLASVNWTAKVTDLKHLDG